MKTFKPLALAGVVLLAACAFAQDAGAPSAPAGTTPPVKAVAPKAADGQVRIQFDHNVVGRSFSAYYANLSQARLKVRVLKQFDPVQARLRDYFIAELTGAGITDSVIFDVDEGDQRVRLVAILERFKSESQKTGALVKRMADRKAAAEKALSQAETKLVELRDKSGAAADLAKAEAEIVKLKDDIAVADEISKMKAISGEMGVARVHMDHPPYSFVGTFEPGAKQLYILRAGFGVQISYQDVDYYIDLLKRAPEFKRLLLEGEAKDARIRAEIKALYEKE